MASTIPQETRQRVREIVKEHCSYIKLFSEGNRMKFWYCNIPGAKIAEKELIKEFGSAITDIENNGNFIISFETPEKEVIK